MIKQQPQPERAVVGRVSSPQPPSERLPADVIRRIWWYRHKLVVESVGALVVVIMVLVAVWTYRRKRR
jgi:hypothetical protein